ncbi:chromosomal replication initiator protein DnaA [uncultured Helicobacter sp.]|uniref:chromosomal replication initiator protein DnaA n=1 Tax=uncultured Helicobacter sp. TaxID=175537 RepID=UPI002586E92A|nr:chromosomal replication initiator protein DnaA [uncultured Helicobacter sp.]
MIWDEVLIHIKEEVTPYDFDTYISQMIYDENSSKTDLAVFFVSNIYIAQWIQSKYAEKIIHIFETITKIKPEIRINITKDKHNVKNSKTKNSKTKKQSLLLTQYTFDNFVVGESNNHAFIVAQKVAQIQGKAFNPVLIYGRTGLGKTHLLNAIGNYVDAHNKNVIYITTEEFMNDYLKHLHHTHTMDTFRDIYRNCDYLLIDDIQFLGGKNQLQEEFFNTFDALYKTQKQIVMTSDKAPKQIIGLEERLRSRFEGGMLIEITPPEIETKIRIIMQKCQDNRINMDKDVINFLAENISENVRQIESIIGKLNFNAGIANQPIDIPMAKNALKEIQKEHSEEITLEKIINIIARELNIKPSEITSKSRVSKIAQARHITIYLTRTLSSAVNSMAILAQKLNMKDHSAISKAYTQISKKIKNDENLKRLVNDLKNKIQNEQNEA